VFGQNHLFVKMLFKKDSTIQKCFRCFCTAFKTEDFRVPVSRPDDVSSRSDAHLSLFHPSGRRAIPSGRPTYQASSVRTTCIPVRTFNVSRSYCSSLHPSGRLNSPSGRLSVIDQSQILSNFKIREDCFNRPDDVDSRPDALIHKARIEI
jgi:hypothetical protein